MAYVGFTRPTIGSFPLLARYSCSLLQQHWQCGEALPRSSVLEAGHQRFLHLRAIFFGDNLPPKCRSTLIDPYVYYRATCGKGGSWCAGADGNPENFLTSVINPSTWVVLLLTCSLQDSIIHFLSTLLPMQWRRHFTLGRDDVIYLTKNPEAAATVTYWRRQGYTVHEIDTDWERTHWRCCPMVACFVSETHQIAKSPPTSPSSDLD